ncbi:hypothetical protein [Halobacteriovorax sp. HLS]|uniref:hypothetical protein n=1 Tax=Halobacteriovorax sp. HLS TaxID=2234000 RepID=UPI000FDA4852|nr:hypothetical protein [Halobacteriovorax sp. HLS]
MNSTKKNEQVVIYCGKDKGYFDTLCQRFKKNYSHLDYTMKMISYGSDGHLSLLTQFIEIEPIIIYIDFSADTKSLLKLSRQLNRLSSFNDIPVVGLIDDTSSLKECWASGVNLTHIKCGEIHDVVYHPMLLGQPDKVKKPTFARGKFKKPIEIDLINDFRIGYITPDYIHAEGDFPQKKGDFIELISSLPKDIIPSKTFTVNEVSNNDLYYDFEYSYNLGFTFVDEPEFSNDEVDKAMGIEDPKARDNLLKQIERAKATRIEDYNNQLRVCKKKHNAWVQDKLTFSKPKKTKILIIDKEMNFLRTIPDSLDQYPYTIRLETILTENIRVLKRIFPHIIAMNFISKSFLDSMKNPDLTEIEKEALSEEFKDRETNSLNQVGRLVKRVRATENYTPFIIVFNCPNYSSKALQDTYEYPLIMCHDGAMDLNFILKMAELFEKKQTEKYNEKVDQKILALRKEDPAKYGRLTRESFEEKRYYVNKSDPLSYVNCRHPIELVSISETDLTFATVDELSASTYRIERPVKCSITIIPVDGKISVKDGARNIYKALIHSLGENQKTELRRYVNDTFFADLNEKREKELEEFQNLNKTKHDEILGVAKKTPDEAVEQLNESSAERDTDTMSFSRKIKK